MLKYRGNFTGTITCHLFIVILYIATLINHLIAAEFDYEDGTLDWASTYPNCSGQRQSPINIMTSSVKKGFYKAIESDGTPKRLAIVTFTNNGHTVEISPKEDSTREIVTGGPLNDGKYVFAQMHFHWGQNDRVGSETLINGKSYPMELHMVYYNQKYGDATNASNFPDGLAVMAVFFKLDTIDNPRFAFTEEFKKISGYGASIDYNFNNRSYASFLPQSRNSFYTYSGSLTTPPCNESVTWIVLVDPVPISHDQLTNFRSFKTKNGKVLMNNYRPVQSLNGRTVYVRNYIETMVKTGVNELKS